MAILQSRDEDAVRKEFQRIAGPVKLVVFSQELVAGDLCRQNEQLIKEVAALSDQISVEVLNPAIDKERAQAYGIEEVPATVPEVARAYQVSGVPKSVINARVELLGAYPEPQYLEAVLRGATGPAGDQ